MLQKYILLFMLMWFMNLGVVQNAPNNNIPTSCSRATFELYKQANDIANIKHMSDHCTQYYKSCNNQSATVDLRYVIAKLKTPYFMMTLNSKAGGCLGYVIEVYEHGKKKNFFSSIITEKKNATRFMHTVKLSTYYDFKLKPIPCNGTIDITTQSLSACDYSVMDIMFIKTKTPKFKHCEHDSLVVYIRMTAQLVCQSFGNDTTKSKKFVSKEPLRERNCEILPYLIRKEATYTINDREYLRTILGATSGALLLLLIIVAACVFRLKKGRSPSYSTTKLLGSGADKDIRDISEEESSGGGNHNENQNYQPKIMILNRPGCEYLDTLVRDLAFILTSYGINVKLSLLEQNQLDAEGGISSYLQRNIGTCDYILIVFTEQQTDPPLPKHRPYEFALKIIGGMAFHQNDCARYIPLYLTSYEDAIKLIPTYLMAAQDVGYKIPRDVTSLLKKLLGSHLHDHSKARELKTNFFINRMKATCKKIISKHHKSCNKEDCRNGTHFPSVSNLSSIWASTVYSKWPSFHSIDATEETLNTVNEEKDLTDAENWVVNLPPVSQKYDDTTSLQCEVVELT